MSQIKTFPELVRAMNARMSSDLAELVLTMKFAPDVHRRVRVLSNKAQKGTLTTRERNELEQWVEASDLLTVLHAKARRSLKRRTAA